MPPKGKKKREDDKPKEKKLTGRAKVKAEKQEALRKRQENESYKTIEIASKERKKISFSDKMARKFLPYKQDVDVTGAVKVSWLHAPNFPAFTSFPQLCH